ncbi:AzlD domain-containing protein [Bacillus sp. B1-b2]|uniref:AzlD domain-containing protein n=1 Tax=Bacillus sp. B1-b2 TaxID=2653201 RepID=UPI0012624E58|nr:AzlD domain-containing protein [Bacillus sp. B1-b2]KAB7672487.1 AzlD domain-containing protein [Bacillus sp. B1-b2]
MISNSIFFALLVGCMLVTLIPRVVPFLIARNFTISKPVEKWLSYLPVCIFTGLIVESLLNTEGAGFSIKWSVLLATIPTFIVAILSKSLLITVLVGVACMAVVRLVLYI